LSAPLPRKNLHQVSPEVGFFSTRKNSQDAMIENRGEKNESRGVKINWIPNEKIKRVKSSLLKSSSTKIFLSKRKKKSTAQSLKRRFSKLKLLIPSLLKSKDFNNILGNSFFLISS